MRGQEMAEGFPIPRQDGVPRPDGATDHRESAPDVPATPEEPPGRGSSATATTDAGASVVAWGDRVRGGGRAGRSLGRLARDGRLLPMVAGLGALAFFGSLVEEWAVTRIPDGGENAVGDASMIELTNGLGQITTFGAGYLIGVLGVLGCLALVFFGTPGSRHNARVAGLAGVGAVLAVLAGATGSLDAVVTDRLQVYGQVEGMETIHGRGLVLAYLGTGIFGLTLLLAGRFVPAPGVDRPAPPGAGANSGGVDADQREQSDWPWRRPRSADPSEPVDDDGRGAPIDLTVSPTKPFVR
ncbi:hypothetical protein [Plantactinospora sonchi]|uniref:Uncharacterized protein n=1 Tax=Plantactinospora sonchi TaxID=1544735 RepID=A0ABU7RPE3_9ACTN